MPNDKPVSPSRPPERPSSRPAAPARDQITESLRALYDSTLKEDLPDRFTDLLEKLRNSDRGKA